MIPCLFKRATMLSYTGQTMPTGQGAGALNDCLSCSVTEEKNGAFSLQMEYPIGGKLWKRIELGDFIATKANEDDTMGRQFFQIRSISRDLGGKVRIEADHISYELNGVIIHYGEGQNNGMNLLSILYMINNGETAPAINTRYLFSTDAVNSGNWTQTPISVRDLMVGSSSLPSIYKAINPTSDLVWRLNNRTISLLTARGQNRGVKIAYGKNLVSLGQDLSADGVIAGYYPYYWKDPYFIEGDPDQVTGDTIVYYDEQYGVMRRIQPLNLTSEFDHTPTRGEVTQACRKYMNTHDRQPLVNGLTVDYIDLARTTEYSYLQREKICLCDKIGIHYELFGIDDVREVTSVTYDPLTERNTKIVIGDRQASLADTILRYGGKMV